MKKTAYKTTAFETTLSADPCNLAYPELQTGSLPQKITNHTMAVNENSNLYHELELRYGGGFAQAIVDGLNKA